MPGLASEDDRLVYRCLRVAGEMNFAPTMWAETPDDEAFDCGWKLLMVRWPTTIEGAIV
jgi:hypothetical protein